MDFFEFIHFASVIIGLRIWVDTTTSEREAHERSIAALYIQIEGKERQLVEHSARFDPS